MRRANADIYYYNCGELGLGQVTMWTRRNGRRCVYSVASDPDCDDRLPQMFKLRERVLYRYGLEHADAVIVQTRRQQQMLHEGFGIKSTVIPMPCEGFGRDTHASPVNMSSKNASVLWVGRISKEKRFEWLLDIAEKCPEMKFEVVGAANTDSDYASVLTKLATGLSNVNMYGRVRHAEIAEYYLRSSILCCTSAYEGFPNTFLEAWSCGIPVISTFDPDGVIAKYNLGWTASSIDGLVSALKESMSKSEKWKVSSESARNYYLTNHTPEACLPSFERLFLSVVGH
jgi:glycosyltransferase involved in cell wall biosynthesis